MNRKKIAGLKAKDKKFVWHPFTQMKDYLKEDPLIIEEGDGIYLKDIEGRKYIDGVSSLWTNMFGHKQKAIDQAIGKQLTRIAHSTLLGLANVPAVVLAEKLIQIAPRSLKKVFYSDSGSEAMEIALKIAYQYCRQTGKHKKKKFLKLGEAYHGDTIGSVSVGGIDLFHRVYKLLLFETIKLPAPFCYRCPYGQTLKKCRKECFVDLEKKIKTHHEVLIGLVMEPVIQGAAGMITHPKGYLKKARELCLKYNILLILDEVATGFGRTGKMFACLQERVKPDIMALAKGISGGYLPLAATLVTQKVYNAFLGDYKEQKTFFHGHTYTGNPLGCAAAIANLDILQKEKVFKKLKEKIIFLSRALRKFHKLEHVGDIRQAGFMVGIELVKDKGSQEEYLWEEKIGIKVCYQVRKYGLILRPLGDVIVLMPPLSISRKELDKMLKITYRAIKEITEYNVEIPNCNIVA